MKEKVVFDNSIAALLLRISNQYSKKPAIYIDGSIYSYDELFEMAKKIAAEIMNYSDQRCVILSGRNLAAYASLLGALLAGKAYVFLNNKDSFSRMHSTFLKIDSSLLLVDAEHLPIAMRLTVPKNILEINEVLMKEKSYQKPPTVYEYAYLMFTSGSTGNPKGLAIKHENLLAFIKNIKDRVGVKHTDRVSQISELTFDFSVHDIFLAWSSGACLYVLPDRKMIGLAKFIQDHEITFLSAVPSTIRLLSQFNRRHTIFESVVYTAFCGEVLSDEIARTWHRYAPNSVIDNLYGPTEATVAISGFRWSPEYDQDRVAIGKAFPGQEILLLNERGGLAEPGEIGEIYLLGSQLANEYWRSKELSAEKFFSIFSLKTNTKVFAYRTGDLAYYDSAHQFHYKGRCDDQLKLRGYRVEKIEIESAIQKIAATFMAAIIPRKCESTGNIDYLTCFIAKSPFNSEEIIRRCRSELPDYMIPNSIIALSEFPYNKNGKVDYQKLKILAQEVVI